MRLELKITDSNLCYRKKAETNRKQTAIQITKGKTKCKSYVVILGSG